MVGSPVTSPLKLLLASITADSHHGSLSSHSSFKLLLALNFADARHGLFSLQSFTSQAAAGVNHC
eukprot:783478-Amphidinium_carterae.3